jgi:DNA polymerase-1
MDGRGSLTPRVLFVGEAPGEDEDTEGRPFVGAAGGLLREFITKYKLHFKDYFITNTVRCRPPKNRAPTRAEIRACNPYLFNEIRNLKPDVIVPLGNIALRAVLGVEGIHSYRNRVLHSDTFNCDILPMLHPAAVLRNPEHKLLMDKDFQLLKEYLAENVPAESRDKVDFGKIIVVQTKVHMRSVFKKILKAGIMFWDLETNGEDVYDKEALEVTCASIACERKVAYVFPLTEYSKSLKTYFVEDFMAPLLEDGKVKKCGQNMNFDAKVANTMWGMRTVNWWFDTMIAHYLIKPVRGTHNLHAMTWEYLAEEAGGYDDFIRSIGGAHKITPGPDLWHYSGLDSSVGFELMTIFEPQLKENGHWQIFREVLMEVSDDLMVMERRGMQFDVPYIKEVSKDYQQQMFELEKKMNDTEGVMEYEWKYGKKFNPNSPIDLPWLLFEHYGLPVVKTSKKTKRPSTDKECIAQYAQMGNEFCQWLQTYRRLRKADSTYLSGLLSKLYEGGISRSNYNLTVTATGRTSSGMNPELKSVKGRAFNMQNIPRDPSIKRIMTARPDHALVAGDLSQIELRVMAAIAKDPALAEAVKVDAHSGMAAAVYDILFEDVTKEQRNVGKMCNFAIGYDVSAEGLAPKLTAITGEQWDVEQAKSLITTLKERFPQLAKWKEFVAWHVKKHGYIMSPLGRRRYFEKRDDKELREAVNMPIQSVASDFMLIGVINTNRLIEKHNIKGWLVNEVHDQIVAEVPVKWEVGKELHDVPTSVLQMAQIMKEGMLDLRWPNSKEPFDWFDQPVGVDMEWGYDMGNLTELTDKDWQVEL